MTKISTNKNCTSTLSAWAGKFKTENECLLSNRSRQFSLTHNHAVPRVSDFSISTILTATIARAPAPMVSASNPSCRRRRRRFQVPSKDTTIGWQNLIHFQPIQPISRSATAKHYASIRQRVRRLVRSEWSLFLRRSRFFFLCRSEEVAGKGFRIKCDKR